MKVISKNALTSSSNESNVLKLNSLDEVRKSKKKKLKLK